MPRVDDGVPCARAAAVVLTVSGLVAAPATPAMCMDKNEGAFGVEDAADTRGSLGICPTLRGTSTGCEGCGCVGACVCLRMWVWGGVSCVWPDAFQWGDAAAERTVKGG